MWEHSSWYLFFVGESDFQWTWWKGQFKYQCASAKCPFRSRINTFLRRIASNCYLLINLVMVVVAKSWAYGELPRSSRRWHFPKLSGLFCGKEIQVRHPQVSTGWFLHWMDYPVPTLPGKRRELFQPQPWWQHPGSRTTPCTRLQVWSPPVNGKTYLMLPSLSRFQSIDS